MLHSININNVACYNSTGVQVEELKKINFIYGANGSGKTTISNYLYDTDNPEFNNCSINWSNNQPLEVLVYNKKFRDNNFSSGNIAGVFTLGQATVEDLELIENKKEQISDLSTQKNQKNETLTQQNTTLEDLTTRFTQECWNIYLKYKDDFKQALTGSLGSKQTFRDKLLNEKENNSSELLSFEDLKNKANTLLGETPLRINRIPLINSEQINRIESHEIWKKIIVGGADVDIARLIGELGNSDWISEGLQYIQNDKDTCPFCQQSTINEDFRRQISEFFNNSFSEDKNTIKTQLDSYNSLSENILNTLDQIETSERVNSSTMLDIEAFSTHLRALHSQFSENKALIQEKFERASHVIELRDTRTELESLQKEIEKANLQITQHNSLVDNFDNESNNLRNSIWRFFVEESNDTILSYERQKSGLARGIQALSTQIETLSEEITTLETKIIELNQNVTSVQPPIDEINNTLISYGFTNFEIVPSPDIENHYVIKRENGVLAHETLSEGEVTFITFLYFVQLTKGGLDQDSVTNNRVLIIDDPISSLDSNVLYIVSTIIKDIIKSIKEDSNNSIKQLLLLTHNVYFHKEVAFRCNGDTNINFWILRKNQNVTSIQNYEQKNPIESSYELLWREIKEWRNNSGVTLQNTMRRIIENYFKILGRYTDEGLVEEFDTHEDQQICRSLLSWINDGSHSIPDNLYVQTPDDNAEKYLNVFKKIFTLTGNEGHYQMMMRNED